MTSVQWLVASVSRLTAGPRPVLRLLIVVSFSFGLWPLASGLAYAQTETATLSGIIQDPKGGVVPGVEVVLTRVETGTVATTTTNGAGIYVFTGLQPGHFRLLVRGEGFKEISIKEFELHVQDKLEQNFSLEIGSLSERVTVEGNGLVINTTDASVSTTIDRNFAENLPLNGRSFQTLVLLTPGTSLSVAAAGTGNGGTFSVNGQRANANSFTVDGVSANLGGFTADNFANLNGSNPSFTVAGTTQGMVSVDALQEFKIQTSTYAPEFGRQPGGQVSLLTRSGTNAFHGTAFDYLRNTVFDANNWFNNARRRPRGVERQNDFGGTLGGRILKDRTFFFFSYEGLRLLVPLTFVDTSVPSLRLRQEAAPAYQAILNSWPIPDGPEFTVPNPNPGQPPIPTGVAPYTDAQSYPTNLDSYTGRIDNAFGRVHLFGRVSYMKSDSASNQDSANLDNERLVQRTLTLGADANLRLNLANEFRANYAVSVSNHSIVPNLHDGGVAFNTTPLFPAPFQNGLDRANVSFQLPQSGFGTFLGPYEKFSQRQVNVLDNLSYSIGPHAIKWGVDYKRLFPITGQPRASIFVNVTSESDIVNSIASQAFASGQITAHPIFNNVSLYGQDTWKVSARVTLTYGLRWEVNPPPGERNGIQPLNVLGLSNPATATLAPFGSSLYKTTYNNFAPRIGVAYQLRQSPGFETVLRAGAGLFYDLSSEATTAPYNNPPFQNFTQNYTNLPGTSKPLPFPLPNNVVPIPSALAPLTPPYDGGGNGLIAMDPNLKLPYTLQWNVALEQQLGQSQTITASYVASAGDRLLRSDSLFDINPNFPFITEVRNASSSNYQSLQLQFNRRLSHGLQALASYTFSHSIDNASDGQLTYSTSLTGNGFVNPNIDKGNSDFDLRHAFRGALTYYVPGWKSNFVSKALLGGWSIDTIVLVQTSLPINLRGGNYSSSFLPDAFFTLRPNRVVGQPLYVYGSQCVAAHGGRPCPGGMGFNPAAFLAVPTDANGNPTQTQGTLGRNVMRGFGAWQADLAIHRQFNLGERVNLQFRSEAFNVFNHPNFGFINARCGGSTSCGLAGATVNNSLGSTGAGLSPLYQIGGPRSLQLALKLAF